MLESRKQKLSSKSTQYLNFLPPACRTSSDDVTLQLPDRSCSILILAYLLISVGVVRRILFSSSELPALTAAL